MSRFTVAKRIAGALLLIAGLSLLAAPAVLAAGGSLWSPDAPGAALLADHRARAVGDLLTIIIVEKAEANQKATTTNEKQGGVSAGPGLGFLKFFPEVKVKGGDDYDATGATTRGGTLNARITVQVTEVTGNGLLKVEGSQVIMLNKEQQKIVLKGIVRPEDVTRDNTVLSTYVANAEITYLGNGAVGDKQQPGIISRIFSWLF